MIIELAKKLGRNEATYLKRWVLGTKYFSIRIHHWYDDDDKRAFHDHPWWFITWVIKGSYTDVSPEQSDVLKRWSIRYRPATHRHYVQLNKPNTWTILITGKETRKWGFWVKGKFRKRNKYFFEHGHH